MIISQNALILTARSMSVETRMYECVNRAIKPITSASRGDIINENFALLKKRGFSFDHNTFNEHGDFKGDNYGNYQLDKITLNNFRLVNNKSFLSILEGYLKKLFLSQSPLIDGHMSAYIQTVLAATGIFIDHTYEDFEVLAFDIENPLLESIRHKYYTLWEHFMSYIVFFNKGDNANFVYIQIGFD